jgi:hypothetical protein
MTKPGRSVLAALATLAVAAAAQARPHEPLRTFPASVLQRLIDRAQPEETVRIPPGIYEGAVRLDKDVSLVGAGAGRTILDGAGAAVTLLVESRATVSRVTVRGGQTGVEFRGPGGILQDSLVTWNAVQGVHCLANAVLFNNRIVGNGHGVAVNSRGPVLLHNTIAGNRRAGIWSWYAPGPTAIHNLVTHNEMALDAGAGSTPELEHNVEWGNAGALHGRFLVEAPDYADPLTERLSPVAGSPLSEMVQRSPLLRVRRGAAEAGALYPAGYLGARRAELELDLKRLASFARRHEPQVTYRLTPEPGVFQVEVAFSRPPFQMGVSQGATQVEVLRAWDSEGKVRLYADVHTSGKPRVAVDAIEPDAPLGSRRYRLLCQFHDPAAWRVEGDRMIFERLTSFEPVRIVAPEGWQLRRLPTRRTEQGNLVRAELVRKPDGRQP